MNKGNKSRITSGINLLALFFVILCGGIFSHAYGEDNIFLMNSGFEGFDMETPVMVYNKSNIFDHINGEAEIYFPLGFKFLFLQSHRKQDTGVVVSVEAYDMDTIKGARAIFEKYTQDGGSKIKGFFEQAWSDEYRVLFYNNKYFIQVMADHTAELDEEPKLEDMVELARQVDKALRK
jgi:hypothetical protein